MRDFSVPATFLFLLVLLLLLLVILYYHFYHIYIFYLYIHNHISPFIFSHLRKFGLPMQVGRCRRPVMRADNN